jgi:prepilin-type N-terminal cleavage/methylation domain-containing protein
MSGFTMVEVLITAAIIAVMTAVSLTSLGALKERRAVELSARKVSAAIREAQSYALTGRNIRSAGDVPCEFRFRVDSGMIYVEQSNAGAACGSDWAGETIAAENGVGVSGSSVVRFSVPRAEPHSDSGELVGGDFVDFSVSRGGTTVHVCVYPLGRVEERRDGC